ncbi:MAG: acyltransferase [Nevskiaceae bacterium]|nr:MAG: acyltransferase [Nevskiaceae bacterium]
MLMDLVVRRIRALIFSVITGKQFKLVGQGFRFFGGKYIEIESGGSFGANCWIQAIGKYKGIKYSPRIVIGTNCCCSDGVHISAASEIRIGNNVLLGSNIYIGDHSHGSGKLTAADILNAPAARKLGDIAPIVIGSNVWVCDGVTILGGTQIAAGSIVAANSVVKGRFGEPGLIAGMPAKLIREYK